MIIPRVTAQDVQLAVDQLAAAEAGVIVDGLCMATAEALAQAKANVAAVNAAVRAQDRARVLVGA